MSRREFEQNSRMARAVAGAVVMLLAASVVAIVPARAGFASSGELFIDAGAASAVDALPDLTIVRRRVVEVDFDVLGGQSPAAADVSDSLGLNLFDDASYTAVLDRTESNSSGSVSWIGHLDSVDASSVILVVKGGVVVGSVRGGGVLFRVGYLGDGRHAIDELDEGAFPPDEPEGAYPAADSPELPASDPPVGGDDGSVIDVLVAYTATARAAAGGTTAMENTIDLAVTETNQSYNNSGINPDLNLVHTVEVVYTESGNIGTDLSRFEGKSDGYMDNVHALRDTYYGDVMTLIVENGGGYCGLASMILDPVSTTMEDQAFDVTARSCATGYYSFGHEIGHLQGARHDWYVDPTNNSPYTYNHGYVDPTAPKTWRTVMAYGDDCGGCTRVQYWSNPDVTYPPTGQAMGVPEGSYHAADNRKTLNNTAWTVANFRPSGPSWDYCLKDAAYTAELWISLDGNVLVRGQAMAAGSSFPAPITGTFNVQSPYELIMSVDYRGTAGLRIYQVDLMGGSSMTFGISDSNSAFYDNPRLVTWEACPAADSEVAEGDSGALE